MRRSSFLLLYFGLACLLSWVIWLPLYLPYFGISGLPVLPYHHALGAFGPLVAAFVMARIADSSGRESEELVRRMGRWQVPVPWYGVALLLPFGLLLVALLLAHFLQGSPMYLARIGQTAEFPEFGFLAYLLYNVLTFGFGEETGWRGYALPRLQEHFRPFMASVVLTLGWALWHLPLFFYRPGYLEMGFGGAIGWLLSLLTGSFLLTWLFNGTRGSILVCALFHATIDVAFVSEASTPEVMQYLGMLITFLSLAVVFRLNKQQPVTPEGPAGKNHRQQGQRLVTVNQR